VLGNILSKVKNGTVFVDGLPPEASLPFEAPDTTREEIAIALVRLNGYAVEPSKLVDGQD
jgi:hypothetical protein